MDITATRPDALPTLVDLKPGAHLCSLYETEEEHRALLMPYLRQGLERGEKVLYIVDARTAEAILDYLRNDGLDVEPFLQRGQLQILTVRDAYLREGTFAPDRMIALLQAATEQAVKEGYPALRVTGEMTWALRGLPGSERLIEYEAKLNDFFPGSRCLALCQYDRRRFTPEVQLDILATHPMVAVGTELHDNPYYLPPAAFLAKDRSAARLEQWLNTLAERRRMEEARRASEETFRAMSTSAQDAIILLDADGKITFWNQAAERIFGYPAHEVLGREMHRVCAPERFHEDYLKGWDEFRLTGKGPVIGKILELVALRRDGVEFPVELSVSAVKLGGQWNAIGILRDITERKQAQEQLHRRNRDLRMVSLCNQALIRASDEATFLEKTCRILVEAGGYRTACVCLAGTDAEKYPDSSAMFGFPPDYLESVRFTWFDLQNAEPIATAVRTGRPAVARRIFADPAFAPWREEAGRFGYASFIALPLRSDGGMTGLLRIHAPDPEAFDAEEVKLLAELADDAAYGIRQLRLRAERRQLSDQLISQGRTLDVFFRYSVTPLVILDRDFNFVRVNKAYAKACHREVSEFAGHNHFEFYPSDARAIFEDVVATKRPYQTVARPFVFPDHPEWGVTYWDWTLTPILDEAGETEFLVFSLKDVTEQKRAEEEIRRSETRLNVAQQVAHIGSWELDLVANRLLWSDEIYRIFELDPKTFGASYEAFLDVVHPEDRAMVDRAYTESVRNKTPYEIVHRLLMPDGRVKFVLEQCETFYDPEGNPLRSVGIVQDSTERKRAEEQIRLVTRALESAANGIVITDSEGTIRWVNPAFTGMTGYGRDEAIGQNPRLLKSGRQDRSFYEVLWHTIKTGNVWHGELINKRKDGSLYTEEMTIAPVRNGGGVISHFVAIKQDVSERKQMERHAQRIEQLAAMGQLLGGIVHELKNPLFIVTGRLQLLKEKLANREYDRLDPDIQKIEDAAQRMGGIAQRFLTLARPIQSSLQVCSITTVLKGVLDFLSNELMKAHIKVIADYAADLPPCLSDPAQLHQAFLNLIVNALQAMAQAHGQGVLKVSAQLSAVSSQPSASEEKPSAPVERWIEVRIQDDGPGIPPEHRAKLFEPFFTTKPLGEGTGLGLWTVRTIVMTLNGTVACESEVGQGATFIVRLPVTKELDR